MSKRLLVLNVDIDDDLGSVGIKTPVLGRDEVLKAAIKFGLARPEDSDLNAIFAALSVRDKLVKEGVEAEVALVSGSPRGGVEAGLKVRSQVEEILKRFKADGVILISDGPDDELVIPIIQQIVPIYSARRVIVEQARGIEEMYVLLLRLFRKALTEERFSRYMIGIPGLIIFTLSLLTLLGLMRYAIPVIGTLLGLIMVVRGFGIDVSLKRWWSYSPVTSSLTIIAVVTFMMGFAAAYLTVSQFGGISLRTLAALMTNALPYFSFGIATLISSKIIVKLQYRDIRVWHEALMVVSISLITIILIKVGNIVLSMPQSANYSQILRALVEGGIPNMLLYAFLVIASLATAMMLLERLIYRTSSASFESPESREEGRAS